MTTHINKPTELDRLRAEIKDLKRIDREHPGIVQWDNVRYNWLDALKRSGTTNAMKRAKIVEETL